MVVASRGCISIVGLATVVTFCWVFPELLGPLLKREPVMRTGIGAMKQPILSDDLDADKFAEVALGLLALTIHDGCRAWKGMD